MTSGNDLFIPREDLRSAFVGRAPRHIVLIDRSGHEGLQDGDICIDGGRHGLNTRHLMRIWEERNGFYARPAFSRKTVHSNYSNLWDEENFPPLI